MKCHPHDRALFSKKENRLLEPATQRGQDLKKQPQEPDRKPSAH